MHNLIGLQINVTKQRFFPIEVAILKKKLVTFWWVCKKRIYLSDILGCLYHLNILKWMPTIFLLTKPKVNFKGGSVKCLNIAGRIELIQSTILPTVQFWCQSLKISTTVLNKVTEICLNFLWKDKYSKIIWDIICKRKIWSGVWLGVWFPKNLLETISLGHTRRHIQIYLGSGDFWFWSNEAIDICSFNPQSILSNTTRKYYFYGKFYFNRFFYLVVPFEKTIFWRQKYP